MILQGNLADSQRVVKVVKEWMVKKKGNFARKN